ncbi:MAG: hypothetical protein R6U32_03505 [Candidatus Woesearchaeota archaeon]
MKRINLIPLDENENSENDPEWGPEAGVYSEESRESLLEEDELSIEEAAFMKGWEDAA